MMWRILWGVGVLCIAHAAQATPQQIQGPAERKPASEAYSADAISAFVDGIMSDKAGDLDDAIKHFDAANKKSPQANTYYNIADVERRREEYDRAIAAYKKYLELAPDAPDRADVEKLIEMLDKAPVPVVVDGDDLDGVVVVDGRFIGPSPGLVRLYDGKHAAVRITPTGYKQTHFDIKRGRPVHERLTTSREMPGNVVIATSAELTRSSSWTEGDIKFEAPGRFTLAPGHYRTHLFDARFACTPLEFDVAGGDHVTFVYVAPAGDGSVRYDRCNPISVKTQKIKVP